MYIIYIYYLNEPQQQGLLALLIKKEGRKKGFHVLHFGTASYNYIRLYRLVDFKYLRIFSILSGSEPSALWRLSAI